MVIIILGIYWFTYSQKNVSNNNQPSPTSAFVLDPKNCAYNIENQVVALVDGYSEQEVAPGSASKQSPDILAMKFLEILTMMVSLILLLS